MAKIVFTLLWAGVLIAVNKLLDDVTWAQYLATFVLAGMYAFAVTKVPGARSKGTQESSEV
ncbi:hypothetical protein [Streptomyces ochraceiscleroticus]|uniref:Uncharacterized protein n=1 Tax=Streptomyces ochraceiscleroticus TaxID=47761 RepID=A0ABW1MPC5_9ACTN|nr:hypothetical protein [Streptomyces ochraceiscleroticus]